MDIRLSPAEARVLGALMEKDLATPEYYPLSLNALANACNQKTNRDPVTAYEDAEVLEALHALRDGGLAVFVHESGSRVEKYRHKLSEAFNFSRAEMAVLAVLLLRGPQTIGELRDRTGRMHAFADLDVVQHTLDKLAAREPDPLVVQMAKSPGMKEARWAHLLSGEPALPEPHMHAAPAASPLAERVQKLEDELQALRDEFQRFKAQFQ